MWNSFFSWKVKKDTNWLIFQKKRASICFSTDPKAQIFDLRHLESVNAGFLATVLLRLPASTKGNCKCRHMFARLSSVASYSFHRVFALIMDINHYPQSLVWTGDQTLSSFINPLCTSVLLNLWKIHSVLFMNLLLRWHFKNLSSKSIRSQVHLRRITLTFCLYAYAFCNVMHFTISVLCMA